MINPTDMFFAVPVVIALVSAIKMTGLSSRWSPIISIVTGVVFMWFFGVGETKELMLSGLIAGLSASGLYSGVKAQFN